MRYKMKTEEKYNFLDSQVGQLYEEGQKKPRSGIIFKIIGPLKRKQLPISCIGKMFELIKKNNLGSKYSDC